MINKQHKRITWAAVNCDEPFLTFPGFLFTLVVFHHAIFALPRVIHPRVIELFRNVFVFFNKLESINFSQLPNEEFPSSQEHNLYRILVFSRVHNRNSYYCSIYIYSQLLYRDNQNNPFNIRVLKWISATA